MHATARRGNEGRATRKIFARGVAGVHRCRSSMTAISIGLGRATNVRRHHLHHGFHHDLLRYGRRFEGSEKAEIWEPGI